MFKHVHSTPENINDLEIGSQILISKQKPSALF